MVQGHYGKSYVDQRLRLGVLYSNVGLDVRVFLGAYHELMTLVGQDIMAHFVDDPKAAFRTFVSLKKICFFDLSVVVDVLIAERERIINVSTTSFRPSSFACREIAGRFVARVRFKVAEEALAFAEHFAGRMIWVKRRLCAT